MSELGYPVADVHVKTSNLVSYVSKNDLAICVKMHVLKTHMQLVPNCFRQPFPKTKLV